MKDEQREQLRKVEEVVNRSLDNYIGRGPINTALIKDILNRELIFNSPVVDVTTDPNDRNRLLVTIAPPLDRIDIRFTVTSDGTIIQQEEHGTKEDE